MSERTKYPTPYQRIMRAATLGCGVRISAEEVQQMSRDTAIEQLAINDTEDERREKSRPAREC